MKVFDKLDTVKMNEAWQNRFNPAVSYYGGKEVAFSPAVQAQVSPYGRVSTGEMPSFASVHSVLVPFEYTGWMDECNAITQTCYIGDWSWLEKIRLSGPDAIKCLENGTINSYKNYPVGKARHIVSITPAGKIVGDGIAFREAENQFLLTGGLTIKDGEIIQSAGFDVKVETVTERLFNFHVQGPLSRKVIEAACGEDIASLPFLCFYDIKIRNRTVRLYRGGMSGELGYELFGDSADGSVIWQAVVEAGEAYGIRQFGFRSLLLNHLQAFFPTIWIDFFPGNLPEEEHAEALYRSPVELGWENLIDKTRDFPGKDVLMKELESPAHKTVMLEWNSEDCISIYASLFDESNEAFEQMPLPVNTSEVASGTPLMVPVFSLDHRMIGLATNRGYSCRYKKVLSITYLEAAYAEPGTPVLVLHGREGKRQTMIRATVKAAPYKPDNRK